VAPCSLQSKQEQIAGRLDRMAASDLFRLVYRHLVDVAAVDIKGLLDAFCHFV
jgi:hypothetical protein